VYIPLPPVGYWQCVAKDQVQHVWYRNSPSRQIAYITVKDACQRNSSSCEVNGIVCRYNPVQTFGRSCEVTSSRGGVWRVHSGFDPCAQALQQCQQSQRLNGLNITLCRVGTEE